MPALRSAPSHQVPKECLAIPTGRASAIRGRFLPSKYCPHILATFHLAAVLRAESEQRQREIYESLVRDLAMVAARLEEIPTRASA